MSNNITAPLPALPTRTLERAARPDPNPTTWQDAVSTAMGQPHPTKVSTPPDHPRNRVGTSPAGPSDREAVTPRSRAPASLPLTQVAARDSVSPATDIIPPTTASAPQTDLRAAPADANAPSQQLQHPPEASPMGSGARNTIGPGKPVVQSKTAEASTKSADQAGHKADVPPSHHREPDLTPARTTAAAVIGAAEQPRRNKPAGTTTAQSSPPHLPGVGVPLGTLTDRLPTSPAAQDSSTTAATSAISAPREMRGQPGKNHVDAIQRAASGQLLSAARPDLQTRATGPVNTAAANPLFPAQFGIGSVTAAPQSAVDDAPAPPSQAGLANAIQELTSAGGGMVRVTLSPASLGSVVIDVLVSAHGQVSIKMTADSQPGQKALGDSISGLSRHMSQAGFALGTVQVVPPIHKGSNASFNNNAAGQGGNPGQNSGQMSSFGQQGSHQQRFSDAPARLKFATTEPVTDIAGSAAGSKRQDDGISAYA